MIKTVAVTKVLADLFSIGLYTCRLTKLLDIVKPELPVSTILQLLVCYSRCIADDLKPNAVFNIINYYAGHEPEHHPF